MSAKFSRKTQAAYIDENGATRWTNEKKQTLLDRLTEGPGSRELSDEVLLALGARIDKYKGLFYLWGQIMDSAKRPDPSRSVDDALALVPEGWRYVLQEVCNDSVLVEFMPYYPGPYDYLKDTIVTAMIEDKKALPRAICLAVLKI